MNRDIAAPRRCLSGTVRTNQALSAGLLRLDLEVAERVAFRAGQFAMLNFPAPDELVFGRPFSILAAADGVVSFLYRVVGGGTARLAALGPADRLDFFGPLGRPFPAPEPGVRTVLVAGGVGLPPLYAWLREHGRREDLPLFGARDAADVPWSLLGDRWQVSLESPAGVSAGHAPFAGLVTELWRDRLASLTGDRWQVLACGPLPLLRAVHARAVEIDWPCLVSVEETMGCGYGVCRGCVVPMRDGPRRSACQEGPVFPSRAIDWERFARPASAPLSGCACGRKPDEPGGEG